MLLICLLANEKERERKKEEGQNTIMYIRLSSDSRSRWLVVWHGRMLFVLSCRCRHVSVVQDTPWWFSFLKKKQKKKQNQQIHFLPC